MMKLLLLVAATVDAQNNNASAGCACISWPWAGSAAFITSPATTPESLTVALVNATGDGTKAWQYPTAYGMDSCQAHDSTLHPYCADANGVPLTGAPGWCSSQWCFIDVNACDVTNDLSSYFHGSDPALAYSYETCAAVNTFADTIHDPAACDETHSAVTAAHCNVGGHDNTFIGTVHDNTVLMREVNAEGSEGHSSSTPEAPGRRRVQGFAQQGGRCLPESARVSNQVQADLLPFFQADHDKSTPLTIAYGSWDSSHILARALKILTEEVLEVDVELTTRAETSPADRFQMLASGEYDVVVEEWEDGISAATKAKYRCPEGCPRVHNEEAAAHHATDANGNDLGHNCVKKLPFRFRGAEYVYTAFRGGKRALSDYVYDFWRSYTPEKANSTLAQIPASHVARSAVFNITTCAQIKHNQSASINIPDGNYGSFISDDGRFYTSACGGTTSGDGVFQRDPGINRADYSDEAAFRMAYQTAQEALINTAQAAGCRQFLSMDPRWQVNKLEEKFDTLSLPFVFTYTGSDAAPLENEILRTIETEGASAVSFYHWEPSSLQRSLQQNGLEYVRILMPQDYNCSSIPEDRRPWGMSLCLETATAAETSIRLNPTVQARLPATAKLMRMFTNGVNEALLESMFDIQNAVLHERTGRAVSATSVAEDEIACAWLRANSNDWQAWVEPAIDEDIHQARGKKTAADAVQFYAENENNWFWAITIFLVVSGVLGCALWVFLQKNKNLVQTTAELQEQLDKTAQELKERMTGMWRIELDMPTDARKTSTATFVVNPMLDANADVESGTDGADMSTLHDVTWYWEEDAQHVNEHSLMQIMPNTNFVQYTRTISNQLEAQHRRWTNSNKNKKYQTIKVTVTSKIRNSETGFDFEMDLAQMVQTNKKSGYGRQMQRVVERTRKPLLPAGMKLPRLPDGVVLVASATEDTGGSSGSSSKNGEEQEVLPVRAGQVVQVTNESDSGEWLFGNVMYDPTTEDTGGGSGSSSGWFPMMLATTVDSADLKKIAQALGGAGMDALKPPSTWMSVYMGQNNAQLLKVRRKGDQIEYDEVTLAFQRSAGPKQGGGPNEIVDLQRVENHGMWQSYAVKLAAMKSREKMLDYQRVNNKGAVERKWLFHGTTHDVVPMIAQQGFNRAFAGKNAVRFGKGVYFARDAAYSMQPQYASKDSNGVSSIFMCRVAVGDYCMGKDGQLTPDFKNSHETFDTTVDNLSNPNIYVAYHDAQVYPEYLIRYKLK